MIKYLLIFIFLISCSSEFSVKEEANWVSFSGRNSAENLYRIKVPSHWTVQYPTENQDLRDSKLPLLTLTSNHIVITIHNFPGMAIPPQQQVSRWQMQFNSLQSTGVVVVPQSFSGYSGLLFEGEGMLRGVMAKVMAWAMTLSPEHQRNLQSDDEKAPITIKAQGPVENMKEFEKEIFSLARSFEMIKPVSAL